MLCSATTKRYGKGETTEKPKRRGKENAKFLKEQSKKQHKGDYPETKKGAKPITINLKRAATETKDEVLHVTVTCL